VIRKLLRCVFWPIVLAALGGIAVGHGPAYGLLYFAGMIVLVIAGGWGATWPDKPAPLPYQDENKWPGSSRR